MHDWLSSFDEVHWLCSLCLFYHKFVKCVADELWSGTLWTWFILLLDRVADHWSGSPCQLILGCQMGQDFGPGKRWKSWSLWNPDFLFVFICSLVFRAFLHVFCSLTKSITNISASRSISLFPGNIVTFFSNQARTHGNYAGSILLITEA